MTREEAIDLLDNLIGMVEDNHNSDYDTALHMAIDVLVQKPCDDAISREWLKNAIHNFYYGLKHIPTEEDIQAYIDAAPLIKIKSEG